ncbi:Alg9-like mannosyltransferase family [Musa troglodytarum]|uniref:Mannosyltransferase n=1 Tax=Musa troglodytarum TaxID=320322 RepID=A0A9E7JEB4_9LILI|nr:Alg9-like mannosyltransferase family [Musa troglodytarum]
MSTTAPPSASSSSGFSKYLQDYGWDLLIGSIAAFYAIMVPYTKVEESFNVQAMHDILYHRHHIEKARLTIFISVLLNILNYDHLDFPGVVPRTFMGALIFSVLASPLVLLMHAIHLSKIYSLLAVRMMEGCIVLLALRFFRIQTCATIVFRCDTVLLFGPIGIELLLQSKSISISEAIKCCISSALLCIGKLFIIFLLKFLSRFFTVLLDTAMWQRILWPELEVFWFNSVLNRSSEWGTQSFHWYFTSALPRSLLVAYPLCLVSSCISHLVCILLFYVLFFLWILVHTIFSLILECLNSLNSHFYAKITI